MLVRNQVKSYEMAGRGVGEVGNSSETVLQKVTNKNTRIIFLHEKKYLSVSGIFLWYLTPIIFSLEKIF